VACRLRQAIALAIHRQDLDVVGLLHQFLALGRITPRACRRANALIGARVMYRPKLWERIFSPTGRGICSARRHP
jgi:hypothetical protein